MLGRRGGGEDRGMGGGRGPRGVTCSDKVFKARLAFLSAELSGCELRTLQRPYSTQIYPVMTLAFPQIDCTATLCHLFPLENKAGTAFPKATHCKHLLWWEKDWAQGTDWQEGSAVESTPCPGVGLPAASPATRNHF